MVYSSYRDLKMSKISHGKLQLSLLWNEQIKNIIKQEWIMQDKFMATKEHKALLTV